jgi:hypothetical protein
MHGKPCLILALGKSQSLNSMQFYSIQSSYFKDVGCDIVVLVVTNVLDKTAAAPTLKTDRPLRRNISNDSNQQLSS